MTQYRKLGYYEIDIICQNPQILVERFDPKEKYASLYDGFAFTPRGISNENGVNYNAIGFTFTGQDNGDLFTKNLHYVCREDGFGLRKETNHKNDMRHGVQRSCYENGNPWTEEYLLNDQYDGLRVFYNKDGRLDQVAMYKNNVPLCVETLKLQWMQKIKMFLGNKPDAETENKAHWERLKKVYPQMGW